MWRLSERLLAVSQYSRFLSDPVCVGAIVNIENRHWIAIVKHDEDLWYVDSLQDFPRLLDERGFGAMVCEHSAHLVVLDELASQRPGT